MTDCHGQVAGRRPAFGHAPCGGIDVGGTKIAAGVIADRGEPVQIGTLPTVARDGAANLASVRRLLEQLVPLGVDRVGLSLATTIDKAGRARDRHGYFGFTGRDLAAELSTAGYLVSVFHDSASGAVAEQRHGAGMDARYLLYVTVGTGVSHCMVVNGRPYAGAHGMGYLSGSIHPAPCGRADCATRTVEDIVSGPGLADAYTSGSTDARPVCAAAVDGEPRASAVIEHAAWHLGALIADLVSTLDPDVVVVGGGLGHGADSYRQAAFRTVESMTRDRGRPDIPLRASAFGPMSCWLGAAELARDTVSTADPMPSTADPMPSTADPVRASLAGGV